MSQEITTSTTVRTTVRVLELTADQVENIMRRWAQREHAFGENVEIDSLCSWDGMFSGMILTEKTSETTEE
jgi:hypothetical protein